VSGSLARFELSAQDRRRSEDLTPAASTTSECNASWPIRRRSWSREHRASCGERMRDPSGPRALVSASSAALRSTRRASATFKRGAGRRRRRERPFTLALFHKRDKKSFPHCILLQSLFGDPSGSCPLHLRRPPPLLDPIRRLSCRHALPPSAALASQSGSLGATRLWQPATEALPPRSSLSLAHRSRS
jgi:hypothetical protein